MQYEDRGLPAVVDRPARATVELQVIECGLFFLVVLCLPEVHFAAFFGLVTTLVPSDCALRLVVLPEQSLAMIGITNPSGILLPKTNGPTRLVLLTVGWQDQTSSWRLRPPAGVRRKNSVSTWRHKG